MHPRPRPLDDLARPRTLRAVVAIGLVLPLALGACGGDDGSSDERPSENRTSDANDDSNDDSNADANDDSSDDSNDAGSSGGEQDAGFGGAGHWSAAQLCTLTDLATMGALFPGVDVVESTGIDEPDWSRCAWDDASIDPLDPASTLFGVDQRDHQGQTFSDSFETIDVPGADQAVFAETFDSDTMSVVLVAVGDQQLSVEFVKDTVGAREVAELVATTWVAMQGT